MRIALAAEGTRGDVHPMLALGGRLRAAGHEVVICAPPDFEAAAQESGLAFQAVGLGVREYLSGHADLFVGGGRKLIQEARSYVRRSILAQFAMLPEATEGADLIIGAGVQMAAPSAAALHGVPYRYVAYCPWIIPSPEYAPVVLPAWNLPRWANRAAWWMTGRLFDQWLSGILNEARAPLGLAPIRDTFRYVLTDRAFLAVDEELAPAPRQAMVRVEQVPCLHPLDGAPLPPKIEAFLDQGPPPVYLGFGSMTDPDPAGTTRSLLETVAALGCRAIVSEGWAGLGEGPLPEGVLAIGSVSHARLFPRMAAVVHHGGAGTTATAARAGVPQLVIPHILDQFYWGKRVAHLGLGPPPLARRKLDAGSLAALLDATLDNEVVSERAREMGARLRSRAVETDAAARLADLD